MKVLPVDLKSWGPGRSLLDRALDFMLAWSWASHAVLRVIDGLHLHTLIGFRLHALMRLRLHILMGSVCTHWWVPSAHTDGLRLHTLMGSVCTHWWVLSTLMGSVYTHWWVPSTHTDGLRLHTLMSSVYTHWWVLSTHTDAYLIHRKRVSCFKASPQLIYTQPKEVQNKTHFSISFGCLTVGSDM